MNVLMLGTALDTNGQKWRYAKAAERWGADPDVLRVLWAGRNDLAGVAGRFSEASVRKPGQLIIRSAHRAEYAFFQFPTDIHWDRSTQREVIRLGEEADVIHLTNDVKAYRNLRLARHRKPAVLHHHGTLFRNNPAMMLSEAKRFHFVQAVSTIDLLRPAPDILRWLPTAYDLDMLAAIRKEHRAPSDTVRIVSAPTNREIKSTAALERAVESLKAEGLPVELVLVEGKTWHECLRIKATADIYFDQVGLGYGCNAVEAWGMSIPVVAGADDWTLARMRQEWGIKTNAGLPFYVATEDTIADRLRDLVTDPTLRTRYASKGHRFAQKYHAEKPALKRLMEVYREAIEVRAASKEIVSDTRSGPGRFRTELRRSLNLRLASRTVQFTDGEVVIEDPDLAERLRRRIQFDRHYQITEVFGEEPAA